jgi:hypothetical protein
MDNFWTLCIAWYSEETVPFSVLKWKLGEANVRHLTSSGDGNISVCGTLYYVQNTKNCIMSINTIILILIYHYHNALELIMLPTFRLTVLQSSHECRHHHWHWQYVYVMFRILYVACLTFHIVSCYTHLVCWYVKCCPVCWVQRFCMSYVAILCTQNVDNIAGFRHSLCDWVLGTLV